MMAVFKLCLVSTNLLYKAVLNLKIKNTSTVCLKYTNNYYSLITQRLVSITNSQVNFWYLVGREIFF